MAVTDLTGTRWRWNWGDYTDPSSCDFENATQAGVVKSINFTASSAGGGTETQWTSMRFRRWHGGDRNAVDYGTTNVWFSDIDGGEHSAEGDYEEFYITGGTDVTNAQLIAWIEANAVQVEEPSGGSISIGSSAIGKAYIGTSEVASIWLGDKQVYGAQPTPSGHTVTIYLSGSTFEMTMSQNTLTVDSNQYMVNGTVGDISTDFPNNGVQITANTVSISGDNFRWKDTDTSAWQTNVAKTWTLSSDNYEIWIEVAIDE